jgi:uncharacterized protein YegP (UPF0339 family)
MAKFEIHGGNRKYWARFESNNGEVVWVTETYTSKQNAEHAIGFVKANAADTNKIDDYSN